MQMVCRHCGEALIAHIVPVAQYDGMRKSSLTIELEHVYRAITAGPDAPALPCCPRCHRLPGAARVQETDRSVTRCLPEPWKGAAMLEECIPDDFAEYLTSRTSQKPATRARKPLRLYQAPRAKVCACTSPR